MSEDANPRLWWPEHLADEFMPQPRTKPEDWLQEQDDGTFIFGSVEADEEESFPDAGQPVDIGDELKFTYLVQLGSHTITVGADGTYTPVQTPEGFTSVWEEGARESISQTLADLVKVIADRLSPGEEESVDIEFLRWGEASFTLGLTNRQRPLLIPVSEPADA